MRGASLTHHRRPMAACRAGGRKVERMKDSMSKDKASKGGDPTAAGGEAAERKARLGAALRANLQRRKAQARGRADTAQEPPADRGADRPEPKKK